MREAGAWEHTSGLKQSFVVACSEVTDVRIFRTKTSFALLRAPTLGGLKCIPALTLRASVACQLQ
eukprot:11203435-Prorocentrum_lima.AAC.1